MLFCIRQSHILIKHWVTFNKTTVDYTAVIQITDTLKWHSHIQLLASKLSKVAFMIKSLKEILSPNLICNIYFTKFHSLLRFGLLFWEGAGGELTTRILRIQKRVIRLMVGVSSRTSCRQLFKEMNIFTMVSLYTLEVICYIRKHHQFVELNSNIPTYNTRRKMDIHIQSYNTELYRRNVINVGTKLYNKLPGHIKEIDS
jgi:hypothetical protein